MKKWRVEFWDWFKGLLFGAGTGAITAVQQGIDKGSVNIKSIGMASVGGAVIYLVNELRKDKVKSATKTIERAGGVVVPRQD